MEKYGFIYIWFDSWRKMYYVGCHWGREDDGYLCSSKRMRDAYRRRPQDFKRRILKRVYDSKENLLLEEHLVLSKIKNEELGKKYYNLTNHKNDHWFSDSNKNLSTRQKMSSNHRSKRGYAPPRLGKPTLIKENAKSKLKGSQRTEKQIAASLAHSKKMQGVKRGSYGVEHGEKISKSRKGKNTGIVPKSAFKHGCVPWNKGRKKGEDYAKTQGFKEQNYR